LYFSSHAVVSHASLVCLPTLCPLHLGSRLNKNFEALNSVDSKVKAQFRRAEEVPLAEESRFFSRRFQILINDSVTSNKLFRDVYLSFFPSSVHALGDVSYSN
jgi:hypothetical protein